MLQRINILIFILLTLPVGSAAGNAVAVVDSVFCIIRNMPLGNERLDYTLRMAAQNLGIDESSQLIDSALADADSLDDDKARQSVWFVRYRYYQQRLDVENIRVSLDSLGSLAEKTEYYDSYFSCWKGLVEIYCAQRNLEYAQNEISRMQVLAIRSGSQKGLATTYQSKGDMLQYRGLYAEAIEYYKKSIPVLDKAGLYKATPHSQIMNCYLILQDPKMVLWYASVQEEYMNYIIYQHPEKKAVMRNRFLEFELAYSDGYRMLEDTLGFRYHLEKASEYYSDNAFPSYCMFYHKLKAKDYVLRKKYEMALQEVDLAMKFADMESQPDAYFELKGEKAQYLRLQGRVKEADMKLLCSIESLDSLYNKILAEQEEICRNNLEISEELGVQSRNKRTFWIHILAMTVIALLFALAFIIKGMALRKALKKSMNYALRAKDMAEKAETDRNIFLNNIKQEIRAPLSRVVECSDKLFERDNLQETQIVECKNTIETDAERLLDIINNVLDFSRLESGRMKFFFKDYMLSELMALVLKKKTEIGARLDMEKIPSVSINADETRFVDMFVILWAESCGYVSFLIQNQHLIIGFADTVRLYEARSGTLENVINERLRMVMEKCRGEYRLVKDRDKILAQLDFPVCQ